MNKLYFILIVCLCTTSIFAQQGSVGIGTEIPDPSAILDLVSTEKGLLIPRMTTQQMMDISSPEEGLLIFDTEKKALCAYSTSTSWQILGLLPDGNPNDLLQLDSEGKPFWAPLLNSSILSDGDNDTKIEVEKTEDEDAMRFTLAGTERIRIVGNSGYIGHGEFDPNAPLHISRTLNSVEPNYLALLHNRINTEGASAMIGFSVSGADLGFGKYTPAALGFERGSGLVFKVHDRSGNPPTRMAISKRGKLTVVGEAGLNDHVASIQNTNPEGSGLIIQIDGKHPMLLPGDIFPPKIPTPLESLVQPIATKIKERILAGEAFKTPDIDDLLDIVNGIVDPNSVNMLKELGLETLVKAAVCDGSEYISEMVQLPDLDLQTVNNTLPGIISNIPNFSEAVIPVPDFPPSLATFQLATGIAINASAINVLDPFSWPAAFSLATTTYTVPSPPNIADLTIDAFRTFNQTMNSVDFNGDLDKFFNGFNSFKNEVTNKFDAADLIISDNLGCATLPGLSEIEIVLPDLSDVEKISTALDQKNHFVTFVDGGLRELGAIKAQHPADYAISQLSTANVLEIAAIIPGIVSDDGNIVENIIRLAGFGYQWVDGYNSIGVSYESSFGDYAEWLPKADQEEEISYGDIIGIKGGFISKDLAGAEQVMVVSKAPIIMGNAPEPERLHEGKNIAFIGQVPVKLMGPVESGDFIVADLTRSGFAKAVNPKNMTSQDHQYAVGRSWDSDASPGFKFVNTLVGMHSNAWTKPMKKMQDTVEKLESRLTAIEDQISTIDLNKN